MEILVVLGGFGQRKTKPIKANLLGRRNLPKPSPSLKDEAATRRPPAKKQADLKIDSRNSAIGNLLERVSRQEEYAGVRAGRVWSSTIGSVGNLHRQGVRGRIGFDVPVGAKVCPQLDFRIDV